MKGKIKGFTLVELLAVIVILSVILVIAVPQIMNVIENTKIGSMESTAKLIAKSAERVYTEKEILGESLDNLNCSDVAKINDEDYDTCEIKIIEDKAIVNIVGKGRFAGKYINNGTKEFANVTEYRGDTLATTVLINSNELIPDETSDKNLRYTGLSPKNYVTFNGELWRILGIFNVSNGSKVEQRVKIVRDALPKTYSWDSSESTENRGYGYNIWETIEGTTKSETDTSTKADLNILLNDYYYNKEDVDNTCYNGEDAATRTCNFSDIGLNAEAKNLIEEAVWNIGGNEYNPSTDPFGLNLGLQYIAERGTSVNSPNITQTSWKGNIGLPYASDFGYASTDVGCRGDLRSGVTYVNDAYVTSNASCKVNNWLYTSSWYWTFSPYLGSLQGVFVVRGSGFIDNYGACSAGGVKPTVYLKTNVKIIVGTGEENDSYQLSIS